MKFVTLGNVIINLAHVAWIYKHDDGARITAHFAVSKNQGTGPTKPVPSFEHCELVLDGSDARAVLEGVASISN